jgi:hypothetical protein
MKVGKFKKSGSCNDNHLVTFWLDKSGKIPEIYKIIYLIYLR